MSEETTAAPEKLQPIDQAIKDYEIEIERLQKQIAWLREHRAKLGDLPRPMFIGNLVDFDNLTHEQVVKVIKTVGGKWKKEPGAGDDTLHYERKEEFEGLRIRCYNGKPPPSCKIIEVEEHVPAQVIPATVRKVRKLVCHPEVGAVIATAREKGLAANPDLSATTLT